MTTGKIITSQKGVPILWRYSAFGPSRERPVAHSYLCAINDLPFEENSWAALHLREGAYATWTHGDMQFSTQGCHSVDDVVKRFGRPTHDRPKTFRDNILSLAVATYGNDAAGDIVAPLSSPNPSVGDYGDELRDLLDRLIPIMSWTDSSEQRIVYDAFEALAVIKLLSDEEERLELMCRVVKEPITRALQRLAARDMELHSHKVRHIIDFATKMRSADEVRLQIAMAASAASAYAKEVDLWFGAIKDALELFDRDRTLAVMLG